MYSDGLQESYCSASTTTTDHIKENELGEHAVSRRGNGNTYRILVEKSEEMIPL